MTKSIVRVSKDNNFVVMDKGFLKDKNLSLKAKGLLAYMLSLPDDWMFYLDELEKHSKDGISSLRSGFKELQDNGYVTRSRERQEDGTFKWLTTVHETTTCENPHVDNPQVEKPQVENRMLLNNKELNNKELNNDVYTLFECWNKKEIIKHRKLSHQMQSHINARLKEYSRDELVDAINNYETILSSDDYYWTHKWTLQDFMKPNNVSRFVNEANPLNNFKSNKKGNSQRLISEVDF